MANAIHRLTTKEVAAIKKPGLHADGGNLYLRVIPSGGKSWAFVFQWQGKRKEMSLGSLLTTDLGEAREKARAARKAVAGGVNPIEARAEEKATAAPVVRSTLAAVAERFIQEREGAWKKGRYAKSFRRMLETHLLLIADMAVGDITTDDVLGVLRPLWTTQPATGWDVKGRLETVLDAAGAWKLRTGDNPARWKGHLELLLPAQRHERTNFAAMPYADLPALGQQLHAEAAMWSLALEFGILTASRTGETIGARWPEIDLEERLWVIPGERMKAGKEHRVPLSAAAVAVINQVPRGSSPYVFESWSNRRPIATRSIAQPIGKTALWDALKALAPDYTVHGFRSTFADWAAEQTDYSHELVEVALAHAVGNQVARTYRRTDMMEKRRQLMEDWGKWVSGAGRPERSSR